jgi:serine protease inhibitor
MRISRKQLWRVGATLIAMVNAMGARAADAQVAPPLGAIAGTVRDSATGPVSGARVIVDGGRQSTSTDASGHFRLDSIPPGSIAFHVLSIGYPLYTNRTVVVAAGRSAQVEIWLRPYDYEPEAQRVLKADSGATGAFASVDTSNIVSYLDFSLKLLRSVVAQKPDSNVFLSPASAGFLLAMSASGATGATWTAMGRTLGVDTLTQDALSSRNAAELASLESQIGVELRIANSLWTSEGTPFLAAFLLSAKQSYHAEVASLPLHGHEGVSQINGWVAKATNGRINSILDELPASGTSMILLNAVYFKGEWIDPFIASETKDHDFTLPSGKVVARKLMARWGNMMYVRDTGVQIVRLPYQGGRIAMYVLLPDSGMTASALISRLTTKTWSRWMRSPAEHDLHLELPRFVLGSGADLSEPLSRLGMAIAFDVGRATFGRMLPREYLREHPTWLADVLQKTWVEVNEQGTEAAAATGGVMITGTGNLERPPPIEFIVDRPFVIAIRDDRTGLLLFLGQITDPVQQ